MGEKSLERDDWTTLRILSKSYIHTECVIYHVSMANLIRQGYAKNRHGWNYLTDKGVDLAIQLGLMRK